jgi:hypothetical protein
MLTGRLPDGADAQAPHTQGRPEDQQRNMSIRALTFVQLAVSLLALVLCFRGRGAPLLWVGLFFLVPILRCLLAPAYRRHVADWLRQRGQVVAAYRQQLDWLPWRAAFVMIVVPTLILFLSNNCTQGSGDTWPVVATACNLATRGNWEVTPYLDQLPDAYRAFPGSPYPYCTVPIGSRVYSLYPAGMVPFALPVMVVARCVGADFHNPRVQERLEKWTASWVAALTLGLFFLLALHLADPLPAAVATLFLATGSVLFSTVSQGLWQHDGTIFWALVVLLVEFRRTERPIAGGTWIQGIAFGMMLACRMSAGLFALAFGLWVLVRSPRRAVAIGVIALLAYMPWALLYQSIYGTMLGPFRRQLAGAKWSSSRAEALAGIVASPSRGLVVYQPWILLGLALCLPRVRRSGQAAEEGASAPAGWTWFARGFICLHLGLLSCWTCWWGGKCWGSRLAAEVVPFFALLCLRPIAVLCRFPAGRPILAGVAVLSFLMHAPAVYWQASYWNNLPPGSLAGRLWSWSHPPFLYPLQCQALTADPCHAARANRGATCCGCPPSGARVSQCPAGWSGWQMQPPPIRRANASVSYCGWPAVRARWIRSTSSPDTPTSDRALEQRGEVEDGLAEWNHGFSTVAFAIVAVDSFGGACPTRKAGAGSLRPQKRLVSSLSIEYQGRR